MHHQSEMRRKRRGGSQFEESRVDEDALFIIGEEWLDGSRMRRQRAV